MSREEMIRKYNALAVAKPVQSVDLRRTFSALDHLMPLHLEKRVFLQIIDWEKPTVPIAAVNEARDNELRIRIAACADA